MQHQQIQTYEEAKKIAHQGNAQQRLYIAQMTDLSPELLFYLAQDNDNHIRQTIARNPATPLQAFDMLVNDKDVEVRIASAHHVTTQAQKQKNTKSDLWKTIERLLGILIKDPHEDVREATALRICDIDHIPKMIILTLANDSCARISNPVIISSPVINDQDMDNLCQNPSHDDVRSALALRSDLPQKVANQIANSQDEKAVDALLHNTEVKLPQKTMTQLVKNAGKTPSLQAPLIRRPGLAFRMIKKLSNVISGNLVNALFKSHSFSPQQRKEIVKTLQERIESGEIEADVTQTLEETVTPEEKKTPTGRAKSMFIQGLLNETILSQELHDFEYEFVKAGWALLAGTRYNLIDKVVRIRHARGVMCLSWKAGFSAKFGLELQQRLVKVPPRMTLYPRGGLDYPLSEEDMRKQINLLEEML